MPPRGRGGRSHRRQKPEGAISSCNLPKNIIVDILSRLPVKSLLRFRCVCKPFKTLFTQNPKFIKLHHHHRITNNTTLLLLSRHDTTLNQSISLLHPKPLDLVPNLDHPFPPHLVNMGIVGSINGLVCLNNPPLSPLITLWNPATKQYRYIPSPNILHYKADDVDIVTVGFAFDSSGDDHKIIKILSFKPESGSPTRVEVYSVNAGTWKEIEVDLPFRFFGYSCRIVVKGVPYWPVVCLEDGSAPLLWFDVRNEVFRTLPVPDFGYEGATRGSPFNYKDSLAVFVYSIADVPVEDLDKGVIDVWVMEEGSCGGESSWSKKFKVGPISEINERLVGCLENGEIVVDDTEGKLLLYDPNSKGVRNVRIDGAQAMSFCLCSYSESLVSIRGSVPIGKLDDGFRKSLLGRHDLYQCDWCAEHLPDHLRRRRLLDG